MNPTYGPAAAIPAPQYGAPAQLPQSQPPKSNVGWAVAAVVFFWPLAFAAFNHATSVYPLWASGDHAGAQHAAERAKRLGVISLAVWAVLCVLVVFAYVALIGWAISSAADIPTTTYSGSIPTTTRGR
ncbi:CD225/dispanin family protein [Rhodococcus hoagii]|uniref:CD225/dispanin family protein n=1 Tax=Rhodococcus hoagii TaxID=43767 RepID=UPI001964DCA2|nr:CD225/dispanin family protein [Prescottella equi]MBM9839640.1 CD225/dispanin family protein [Prescottella equi]